MLTKSQIAWLLASLVVASACGSGGGGGGAAGSDAGNTGGSAAPGCRVARPACSACLSASCAAETADCYGQGWAPDDLCSSSGAAAMCTNASSAKDGLAKQKAFSSCVLGACLAECD